jgi:hypothetical protein
VKRRLTQKSKQKLGIIKSSKDEIIKSLSRIKDSDLEEIVGRDQVEYDPAHRTSGDNLAIASGGGNYNSPVESAVIAKNKPRQPKDPVKESVKQIIKNLVQAERLLRRVEAEIASVFDMVEKKKHEKVSAPCLVCEVLPVEKRGMCFDCYAEWAENGAPSFNLWVDYKQGKIFADGTVVITKPLPRQTPLKDLT